MLERDAPADDPIPTDEAAERFAAVVTALRLWAPGGVIARGARLAPGRPGSLAAAPARLRRDRRRAASWMLAAGDEQAFREFFAAIDGARPPETVAWALDRFEMGCERAMEAQALSDYLLALRALLDATDGGGPGEHGAAAGGAVRGGGRARATSSIASRPRSRWSAS